MGNRIWMTAALMFGVAASPLAATDKVAAREAVAPSVVPGSPAPAVPPTEALAIAIVSSGETVWSGTMRIGGPYGSANFSQSRSEYGEPCPGQASPAGRYASSSESVSIGVSRYNWQQEPDRFSINVNWSKPISSCAGEGNDTFGFTRVVTLPRGATVTVEGSGGMTVRLSRPR